MSRAQITTSARHAISRQGGIAVLTSSTICAASSIKRAYMMAAHFMIAGTSKQFVELTTSHPISTRRWTNSNRNNPRQTINRELPFLTAVFAEPKRRKIHANDSHTRCDGSVRDAIHRHCREKEKRSQPAERQ